MTKENLKRRDWLRYGLWGLMAYTAAVNRSEYKMVTTWLPHFVTNTVSLLLPDALRAVIPREKTSQNLIKKTLIAMARDNPDYVVYVAPLALGYITSHPHFNIYKGEWAEYQLAGLRLDAIPHAATAFALGATICDTLETAAGLSDGDDPVEQLVKWGDQHCIGLSLGVLAFLTFIWEYGEYRMHHYEMGLQGDLNKINMMWTKEDTARDVISNFIGWALAMMWQSR